MTDDAAERPAAQPARPRVSGHRGSPMTEPENTLRSFRRALADGADLVELDVRISADDALVVMHDATLDRTTDGTGPVADHTLEELGRHSVRGEKIPLLEDVLDGVAAPIQIEIKHPSAVGPLLTLLGRRQGDWDRLTLTSLSEPVMTELTAAPRALARGLITTGYSTDLLARTARLGCSAVYTGWDGLTPAGVRALHDAGLHVAVWSVATAEHTREALAIGVDELSADHPAQVVSWLDEMVSPRL